MQEGSQKERLSSRLQGLDRGNIIIAFYNIYPQSDSQPMGQQSSKPISNKSPLFLTHLYSPHTHKHGIPGQPLLLRLNQHPKPIQKTDKPLDMEQTIESYQVELYLSEEQALENRRVYAERKNSLPWHVRVLSSELVKDQCHCANNKYKATVYTEHVETRLCNFRVADPTRTTKYAQMEMLDSFNFSQSVYVLINILHGFQLLIEQFRVNYPSSYSIGINRKGQVKVWLCDNWAINRENSRAIPQNLLIQEIINLVQERSRDTLCQFLDLRRSYMSWSFDSLQEILAKETIHFNQGRKSLEKRVGKMVSDRERKERSMKKFPMNKVFSTESSKFSLPLPNTHPFASSTTERQSIRLPTTERRTYSNQTNQRAKYAKTAVEINFQANIPKREQTSRSTINESPRKPLKFTYESQKVQTVQPSPKMSVPTYSSSQAKQPIKCHFSHQYPQNRPKVNSVPQIQKQPQRAIYKSHPRIEEEYVMRKLVQEMGKNSNSGRTKQTPTNLGMEPFVIQNIQKVESAQMFQKREMLRNKTPKIVEFQLSDPKSEEIISPETPKAQASLTQITTEFKNLLKSDQKIKEDDSDDSPDISSYEQVPLDYQSSQKSEKQLGEGRTFNQKSEEVIPSYWQINFESIKEVDEDVSYDG